ncbi:uncharacterized protein RCO7_02255 [Rhynchosporium graminicola]|uniref:BTB domain-containing protein n=1 Tax=Rhynchosporium graminicola TaxID=2792576 RepID=A0A1E1LHN3_9HELO|nr:uncharacterized protein RCO7_02255 [Rhynchosporium commune]
MITLRVGSAGKEFTIHKNLACCAVDFLKANFESGLTEAGSGIMHLPEDDQKVILLLVDWIYGRTIPTGYTNAPRIRSSTSTSSLTRFIESLSGDQGMWSQEIQRNWLHKPDLKDTWDIVKGDSTLHFLLYSATPSHRRFAALFSDYPPSTYCSTTSLNFNCFPIPHFKAKESLATNKPVKFRNLHRSHHLKDSHISQQPSPKTFTMDPDANLASSSASTHRKLGKEIVSIYVGPKRKEFMIHKELIYESDFFRGAFSSSFAKAQEGTMCLSEDSPAAFDLYVEWPYRKQIPAGHSEFYLHSLYDFDIMADKFCHTVLKDIVMNAIQELAKKHDLLDAMFARDQVLKVFSNTTDESDGLALFLIHLVYYAFISRMKNEKVGVGKGKATSKFGAGDLDTTWDLGKDNKVIFMHIQDQVLASVRGPRNRAIIDPRQRNEQDSLSIAKPIAKLLGAPGWRLYDVTWKESLQMFYENYEFIFELPVGIIQIMVCSKGSNPRIVIRLASVQELGSKICVQSETV